MLFLCKHPFKSVDLKEKKYGRATAGAAQSLPGAIRTPAHQGDRCCPLPSTLFPSLKNATASRKRPAKPVPTGGVGSAKHQSPTAGVCSARFAMTPHGEKWGKTGKRNKDEKATKMCAPSLVIQGGKKKKKEIKKERKKPQTSEGQ